MDKIFNIYKATNKINGKIYIGFTSDFERRQKVHKRNASIGKDQAFYRAIRKYRWENFEWEIIYCSKDGEFTLKIMEPYFIKQFESFGNPDKGYNMTSGGDSTIFSGETRLKMSLSRKKFVSEHPGHQNGKLPTKETKLKMSQAQKMRYKRNPHLGHSKIALLKMANSNSFYWEIEFPDGHLEVIHNLNRFCQENNLSITNMSSVASGRRKHHKNFVCRKLRKIKENYAN